MEEKIQAERLLEEIKVMLKDLFVAAVRKKGDELELKFSNGQSFTVTVWENKR